VSSTIGLGNEMTRYRVCYPYIILTDTVVESLTCTMF